MRIHPGQYPALLLNADFAPVSVFPLSTLSWMDAVKNVFSGKLVTVCEYDAVIPTPNHEIRFPSVVALREYKKVPRGVPFNRHNIWLRDEGRCVYCNTDITTQELTFDHVYPRSLGGATTWENIVCSCQPCNTKKDNMTVDQAKMHPLIKPKRPTPYELARKHSHLVRKEPIQREWVDFLYWEGELEA